MEVLISEEIFIKLFRNSFQSTMHSSIPSPPGNILFGHLLKLRQNPIEYFSSVVSSMGDVVKIKFGIFEKIFLSHPDYIKQILADQYTEFDKGSSEWGKIKIFFGKGIMTTDGAIWAHQRRTLQPEFQVNRIPNLGEIILEEIRSLVDRWEDYAQENKAVHLHDEMLSLTLRVVTRAMFSEDFNEERVNQVKQNLSILHQYGSESLSLFDPPIWVPTFSHQRVLKARKNLNELIFGMIRQRRKQEAKEPDLLSRLVAAQDPETGEKMGDVEIRDHLMAVMLAGHESSTLVMTFTWMLLAQHLEQQEKLFQEITQSLVESNPLQTIKSLPFTLQVLQEGMRLYPPVWAIFRRNLSETSFGKYIIPAHKDLFLFTYYLHRHPDFWENPSSFKPERFSIENNKSRHPYAYIPFGAGPHVCIGREFAMLEILLTLAILAKRFRIRLDSGFKLELKVSETIRSKNPLFVFLEKRK